ncbi:acyl-CoA--sterol O-acyltransferase [Salix suchowensis]|nr:acyl-CoA--sterol O-acyltransferase [Salix suchowensis]
MESEICNLIEVWLSVFASVCYCYAIGKVVPKGTRRLVFLLPIVCLFLYLPLHLFVLHFRGITAFFIAWLANFKLLLFAFGKGPLSSDNRSISLPHFVAVACLPIKIQHKADSSPKSHIHHAQKLQNGKKSSPNYGVKTLLLAILVNVHNYSDYIHPKVVSLLNVMYLYIQLEIILAIAAAVAKVLLGLELEPQFDEPYLSTSLQDFWGRRWNLMVSSILRLAVYEPTRNLASGLTVYEPTRNISKRFVGRRWSPIPAVLATFLLSAIMHEVMFYYLLRVKPTWEVTWFFLLHGFCVTLEIAIKKALKGRWQLPRLISGLFTVGFVLATSCWLFFPKPLKCRADARAFEEYAALRAFGSDCSHALFGRPSITRSH